MCIGLIFFRPDSWEKQLISLCLITRISLIQSHPEVLQPLPTAAKALIYTGWIPLWYPGISSQRIRYSHWREEDNQVHEWEGRWRTHAWQGNYRWTKFTWLPPLLCVVSKHSFLLWPVFHSHFSILSSFSVDFDSNHVAIFCYFNLFKVIQIVL